MSISFPSRSHFPLDSKQTGCCTTRQSRVVYDAKEHCFVAENPIVTFFRDCFCCASGSKEDDRLTVEALKARLTGYEGTRKIGESPLPQRITYEFFRSVVDGLEPAVDNCSTNFRPVQAISENGEGSAAMHALNECSNGSLRVFPGSRSSSALEEDNEPVPINLSPNAGPPSPLFQTIPAFDAASRGTMREFSDSDNEERRGGSLEVFPGSRSSSTSSRKSELVPMVFFPNLGPPSPLLQNDSAGLSSGMSADSGSPEASRSYFSLNHVS